MKKLLPVLLLLSFSLEAKFPMFKKKHERVVDPAQSVPLKSRIPCDGATSPEDHPVVKASFSQGGWERAFTISAYQHGGCNLSLKVRCVEKQKEGFQESWMVDSAKPAPKADQVSIRSCTAWGSTEAAENVLSAWYQEGPADPKLPWKQAPLKKVSSTPDIYEFTDPQGGTARLEISIR